MPNYRYQVRGPGGQIQVGVLSADSVQTAATVLRNQGLHILAVNPVGGRIQRGALLEKIADLNSGKPNQKHVLEFTTQLAVMIRAGINLRASLEGIADQTQHRGFRKVINQLKTDVESGKSFSEALARHPKLFGPLYVNMVRASEMAGSFSQMLDRIAGYIAQQIETRKMVVGASIYPGIIGTMAVAVTVFLLTFVLPKFKSVFEGKEDALPGSTKFLMGLSEFLQLQWPYIVAGLFGVGVAGFLALKTEPGGLMADRLKLSLPVFKNMFRSLYISRSLHTKGQ
ncbi:MAG: type II secretion system F family protein, partial [Phycisphaerales bacterium]|nr:type II secretion system F family protein [Phycisphaerales bacterium]